MNTTTVAVNASSSSKLVLPLSFILLWSSGYIGGAIGLDYAEPFTMTFLRFGLAALLLLGFAQLTKAPWPSSWKLAGHIAVVGVLMQAVQLAEKVSWRQWTGLGLWLAGVAIVVGPKVHGGGDLSGYLLVGLALVGITAGTLYQKKFCGGMDLRTGGFIQMTVAASIMLLLSTQLETMTIEWSAGFVGSVLWLAVMNSIGAISLLWIMIRRGEASKVASLFYLIPPVTAIMASAVLAEMPGNQK